MQNVYLNYAIPIFFLFIGLEAWKSYKRQKNYCRLNDSMASIGCGTFTVTLELFAKAGLLIIFAYLYEHVAIYQFSQYSIIGWILFFFVFDFIYYWAHRWSHEINFLWGCHVPHHQSEEMNLTTALRQGALQDTIHWPLFLTVAIMGCHPLVFITHLTFSKFYQFWIHTQFVGKTPLIEGILNTPSAHRVHHGINEKYIDKNHGATLMIWDRLFGTYQVEEEEVVFGVRKPLKSWNPVWAQFDYWYFLWQCAKETASWRDKTRIWFMPTGWRPADVVMKHPIPEFDLNQFNKFDSQTAPRIRKYILLQFVLVLLANGVLIGSGNSPLLPDVGILTKITLAIYTTTGLIVVSGLLSKSRQYNRIWELLRHSSNCILALIIWSDAMIISIAILTVSALSLITYFAFATQNTDAVLDRQMV